MHARVTAIIGVALALTLASQGLAAHDLEAGNADYVRSLTGAAPVPFVYLGAKHMFTGVDHLLFLLGVVFYLFRARDVVLFVTLFTLGHSLTLLLGVWRAWSVDPYLVDAVIGASIVYKAFENLGGFRSLAGIVPDARVAVFAFGLVHGLGLATRLQGYVNDSPGLLPNLLSFNLGIELGQLAALGLVLLLLVTWRRQPGFARQAYGANAVLLCAGFVLAGNQFAGWLLT